MSEKGKNSFECDYHRELLSIPAERMLCSHLEMFFPSEKLSKGVLSWPTENYGREVFEKRKKSIF